MPILLITSEASCHAPYDYGTIKYLERAGVYPSWIRLADVGTHGNAPVMMPEKNNDRIAATVTNWLKQQGAR